MSIGKSTAYNVIGSVVPLLLAFFTIPLYLGLVGVERYGALAIAWLILGYFGLFDLGLGRATAQRIAALRDSDPTSRSDVFWTAAAINIGMGLIGGIILYFSAVYFFNNHFKASDALLLEIGEAIPFLACAVPIATLTGVAGGALQGREKFLALNIATIVGTSLFQIIPLLVAIMVGPTLKWLILAAIIARIIGLFVFFSQVHKNLLTGIRPQIDRTQWVALLKYGGWVSATAIVGPLLVMSDRFMIGALVSAAAVAVYAIAFEIIQRISVLPRALSTAIFPRMASGDDKDSRILAGKASSVMILTMTPAILLVLYFIQPFLIFWVGNDIAVQAAPVGRILALGIWVNALAVVPYARLQAIGRPDLVTKAILLELPIYLASIYFALTTFGLPGAAAVFSIRSLIDYFLLSWLSDRRFVVTASMLGSALLCIISFIILFYVPNFSALWWCGLPISLLAGIYVTTRDVPIEIKSKVDPYLPSYLKNHIGYR